MPTRLGPLVVLDADSRCCYTAAHGSPSSTCGHVSLGDVLGGYRHHRPPARHGPPSLCSYPSADLIRLLLLVCGVQSMSLTTIEYALQRSCSNNRVLSIHGPYETLELARQQQENAKKHEPQWDWEVVERDITPWTVVPIKPPPFVPEDD
jgi:hypothetical protein